MKIVRFEARHVEAVKRLNLRLAAAGETWHFPERPQSLWLPETPGQCLVEHYYVAEDGNEVRGGYILKWQPFWLEGRTENVCTLYLPLSEGIINQAFRLLGLTLIRDALARHPLAFCLGMGGAERALPQTLKMLGWQVHDLPFFFLPLRAGPFLSQLQPLQASPWKRAAARLASVTGAAAVALAVFKVFRRPPSALRRIVTFEEVDSFGSWADSLWSEAQASYSLCADRRRDHQNRLYRSLDGANCRVLVRKENQIVGWFVARNRLMSGHKYFGNMRVGSVIDALSLPGQETAVAWAARCYLDEQGADIIVGNMQHRAWLEALTRSGFLKGPSNFALAASPALASRLEPYSDRIHLAHFLRGDGEGPTHL
jgi:hypothetical protein